MDFCDMLPQIFGSIGAKKYVEYLTNRMDKRATAIMASGSFVSKAESKKY